MHRTDRPAMLPAVSTEGLRGLGRLQSDGKQRLKTKTTSTLSLRLLRLLPPALFLQLRAYLRPGLLLIAKADQPPTHPQHSILPPQITPNTHFNQTATCLPTYLPTTDPAKQVIFATDPPSNWVYQEHEG